MAIIMNNRLFSLHDMVSNRPRFTPDGFKRIDPHAQSGQCHPIRSMFLAPEAKNDPFTGRQELTHYQIVEPNYMVYYPLEL